MTAPPLPEAQPGPFVSATIATHPMPGAPEWTALRAATRHLRIITPDEAAND